MCFFYILLLVISVLYFFFKKTMFIFSLKAAYVFFYRHI